jgi:hypothetical protein
MGGGESSSERRAREEQERRSREQQTLANQYIQIASQPDPLEERLRERDMGFLDWESGKSGPIDVRNAPGLGPSLALYENAATEQAGERQGIGALRMGLNASNPSLAQLLEQQSKDRRQQSAAGGLEEAVRMRSAEANRSALGLAQFGQERRMGLAGLTSSNANTATGQYLQFLSRPRRPSFWSQVLGGAAQVGSAYFTGGFAGGGGQG